MVERKTLNLVVAGSIPAGGVLYKNLSFLVCKNSFKLNEKKMTGTRFELAPPKRPVP